SLASFDRVLCRLYRRPVTRKPPAGPRYVLPSMSSPPRVREREEARRLSVRTLLIASVAAATAAIVTSQIWASGTPIAAAVTPVIVALVSELLHRPTEAIARRVTTERSALLPRPDRPQRRAPSEPASRPAREAPVRVYGRERRPRRRKVAVGV